jgi:uncharacterized delta-60 repeat protein
MDMSRRVIEARHAGVAGAISVISCLLATWMAGAAFARPVRDASFGNGGRVLLGPFDSDDVRMEAVARQPDGKLLAAGQKDHLDASGENLVTAPVLVRLLPAGGPDPAFGSGGVVLPARSASFSALAIQRDGKVLAGGASDKGFVLARYLADGSPDPHFGTAGVVVTAVGRCRSGQINSIIARPDGRIVVAGAAQTTCNLPAESRLAGTSFALARYNADGTLDRGFGNRGAVITRHGAGEDTTSVAVLLAQRDGSLLAAGTGNAPVEDVSEQDYLALAKYRSDGRLDPHYGRRGVVVDPSRCGINAATPSPHGRLLVAARPRVCHAGGVPLWRFLANGRVDRGFGRRGQATGPGSLETQYLGVFSTGGRILAVGVHRLVRFKASGKVDSSYSGRRGANYVPGGDFFTEAALLQPDRRLVAVGYRLRIGVPEPGFVIRDSL